MPLQSHSNVGKHFIGEFLCRINYKAIGIGYETNGYARFRRPWNVRHPQQIRGVQRRQGLAVTEARLRGEG